MNISAIAKESKLVQNALLVVFSSLLIGLVGRLEIPLPFTPVPISFRIQIILFLSLLLGPKRATLATALFLLQGALGMPVFAGGTTNAFGPCGGYILGYLFASYFTGLVFEKTKKTVVSITTGTLIIYLFGYVYLGTFIGAQKAFVLGILPFIIGDIIKSVLFLNIFSRVRKTF